MYWYRKTITVFISVLLVTSGIVSIQDAYGVISPGPAPSFTLTKKAEHTASLIWTLPDNAENPVNFKLERKINDGSFQTVITTSHDPELIPYSDHMPHSSTVTYRISFSNSGGPFGQTTEVITSTGPPTIPSEPIIEIETMQTTNSIYLYWNDPITKGGHPITYDILGSQNGVNFFPIETNIVVSGFGFRTVTTYDGSTALSPGTLYHFKIIAKNPVGSSDSSIFAIPTAHNNGATFNTINTFPDYSKFGTGTTFTVQQNFGKSSSFTTGTTFSNGQSFPIGSQFENMDFEVSKSYDFTARNLIFFDIGDFGIPRTFGPENLFSGITFDESHTFGKASRFETVTFDAVQTFSDNNDFFMPTFTLTQTLPSLSFFSLGSSFAPGQILPVGTFAPWGITSSEVSCSGVIESCKPTDESKFISPKSKFHSAVFLLFNELLFTAKTTGTTIESLGIFFKPERIITQGTFIVKPLLPSSVSSTFAEDGDAFITIDEQSYETVGNIIDLKYGTAVVSGETIVHIQYLESEIPSGISEDDLVLLHQQADGSWIEEPCIQNKKQNRFICSITSFSAFSVGAKSGSTGASSGAGAAAASLKKECDSKSFGLGKSLAVYEISYDLCEKNEVSALAYSTCGSVSYKLLSQNKISKGSMAKEQPYLKENKIGYVAQVDPSSNSFRVVMENDKDLFEWLIVPKKLHNVITQCTDKISIPQITSYTSFQQNTIPDNKTNTNSIRKMSSENLESTTYFFNDTESTINSNLSIQIDSEPITHYVSNPYQIEVDPEPISLLIDPEPQPKSEKLSLLSWVFQIFIK